MLIFTFKARRLISRAVNAYGNDDQREIWRSFVVAHPEVRRGPADPHEDGTGAFPPDVAEVAHSVLNQMFNAMQLRLKSAASEDKEADISNDLAFIRSVVKTLSRHAPRQAAFGHGVSF
ncbi:MAG TPA: hypothetical protein VEK82_08700 [Stellaceae bacterium]|nr:hypothetical protein [Stellaceae bacterium]